MSKVVIMVRGGIVQAVHSEDESLDILIYDFDDYSDCCPRDEDYFAEIDGLVDMAYTTVRGDGENE